MKKKIGIMGFGKIGQFIYKQFSGELDFVFIYDKCRPEDNGIAPLWINNKEAMLSKCAEVDLVVECATADLLKDTGEAVLQKSNLMPLSLTAFADEKFEKQISDVLKTCGNTLYIPHGAVLGLDGIYGARGLLQSVKITTIKRPQNLGLQNVLREVVYDGSTRGACFKFPRNVNVHAAIAICGKGMDETNSVIISDPEAEGNMHLITVEADGCTFKMEICSKAGSGVTGAYTPISAVESIRQILLQNGIAIT